MAKKIGTLKIDAVLNTSQLDNAVRGINGRLKGIAGSASAAGGAGWGPGSAIGAGANYALASGSGAAAGLAAATAASGALKATAWRNGQKVGQMSVSGRLMTEYRNPKNFGFFQNAAKRLQAQRLWTQLNMSSTDPNNFEFPNQAPSMGQLYDLDRARRGEARAQRRYNIARTANRALVTGRNAFNRVNNFGGNGMLRQFGTAYLGYGGVQTMLNFGHKAEGAFSDFNAFQNYRGASTLQNQYLNYSQNNPTMFQGFALGTQYKGGTDMSVVGKIGSAYAYATGAAISGLAQGDIGPTLEALQPWTGNSLYMNALGVATAPTPTNEAVMRFLTSGMLGDRAYKQMYSNARRAAN